MLKRKIDDTENFDEVRDDVETKIYKYGKKCIREQQKKTSAWVKFHSIVFI